MKTKKEIQKKIKTLLEPIDKIKLTILEIGKEEKKRRKELKFLKPILGYLEQVNLTEQILNRQIEELSTKIDVI